MGNLVPDIGKPAKYNFMTESLCQRTLNFITVHGKN